MFASDVEDRGGAAPGDLVSVVGPRGKPLGLAHYSSCSQITLRMLAHPAEEFSLAERLTAAWAFRRRVVNNTSAFRLVYSEGDRLPGLIVDRYGDHLVLQTLTQGMERLKQAIVSQLAELVRPQAIIERNDAPIRQRENLPLSTGVLSGELHQPVQVKMNDLCWEVDLLGGQKTGLYLDQRENYLAAARYARGRVLDCFTGCGGFALHVAGSVESVEAIDSSAPALELARRNASLNGITNVNFTEANVFDWLSVASSRPGRFDMIILDPPAFAKSRSSLEAAARGYKEINLRALRLLTKGGILISCSCSHHFSEAALLETIAAAAADTHSVLRVLERRTQAQDHPILLCVPETHYLKCLIFEVL